MRQYSVFTLFSPQLNKEFRVFYMLPTDYYESDESYKVLYMHDGQNLFDDKQAPYGKSWGILENYDRFSEMEKLIIVGVETSGEERPDLLVPFEFKYEDEDFIRGGKTDKYLDFLTKTLKPLIDSTFRTKKERENTALMGSSYGGLCTLYASVTKQDVFSKFGCVSNAFDIVQDKLEDLVRKSTFKMDTKIYLDVGTSEASKEIDSKHYVASNDKIYAILERLIKDENLLYRVIASGIHNESDWEKRFPGIIEYLFEDTL